MSPQWACTKILNSSEPHTVELSALPIRMLSKIQLLSGKITIASSYQMPLSGFSVVPFWKREAHLPYIDGNLTKSRQKALAFKIQ